MWWRIHPAGASSVTANVTSVKRDCCECSEMHMESAALSTGTQATTSTPYYYYYDYYNTPSTIENRPKSQPNWTRKLNTRMAGRALSCEDASGAQRRSLCADS
ncbi:hypothetical protein CRUP_005840 [Coryphaenoides rupestris]|nr:hypothetical protein CRUP_005840 [Coryphaenoides rupestris]